MDYFFVLQTCVSICFDKPGGSGACRHATLRAACHHPAWPNAAAVERSDGPQI